MLKRWIYCFLVSFVLLLVACSSDESTESSDSANQASDDSATEEAQEMDMKMADEDTEGESGSYNQETEQQQADTDLEPSEQSDRKVIYNANLHVEVEDYTQAVNEIQSQVEEKNGYIVESSTYGRNEGLQEGRMQVRIPQEHFRNFIAVVENGSLEVVEKNVTGQDVTEEFVDLESRLKSKRVVEERLISFMEEAEETEDLLQISNDLADVQEEIEEITGRLNYLQNKADLATVTIQIYENRVDIPNVNQDELNTWERTKQQFMESINFLLSATSGLTIFIIGNLPTILLLAIIGLVVYRIVRKQRNKEE